MAWEECPAKRVQCHRPCGWFLRLSGMGRYEPGTTTTGNRIREANRGVEAGGGDRLLQWEWPAVPADTGRQGTVYARRPEHPFTVVMLRRPNTVAPDAGAWQVLHTQAWVGWVAPVLTLVVVGASTFPAPYGPTRNLVN